MVLWVGGGGRGCSCWPESVGCEGIEVFGLDCRWEIRVKLSRKF